MSNLNHELWIVFLPGLSSVLFALGGTEVSREIKGQKWLRRYVLPVVLGLSVYFAGFAPGWAVAVTVISAICFPQGYGEKASWAKRVLIFTGYGCISLPIGISWWNLMCVIGCIGLFALSNWKVTADTFVWKTCEIIMGFLVGMQVAFLLSGNGLVF
jgi:hypothetical protein